ncbi:H-NS family nucleoid-associated regulatory protein [Paraburkholderia sp. J8-2]|uniref:H-NS family nucleoid-associated regulatory protein n=1 Tax=Paraburkholderia sp. J8-2 TaxID=2805440 RepID=UPI002AB5F4D6|nr:H-NS family nucleoid-associated regulatory protein [Paraburkholderia sp. J8-2]
MAQRYTEEARERLIVWIRRKMEEFGITTEALSAAMSTPTYRDAKGNEWTGRGEPPDWIKAAERAGVAREFFLQAPTNLKNEEPAVSAFFRPRH